jgi:hypothetical protein
MAATVGLSSASRNGPGEAPVRNDPNAHDALRAAHDGGYRFPEGFHGFTAAVAVTEIQADGAEVRRGAGSVTIGGPRAIELALDGDDLASWVRGELASMAGHRWPTPYEQADGRWTLSIGVETASPLGRLITVHDDPFQSAYRLRDGRISQVIRTMGGTRFTITIQGHTPTDDGRVLPATFTVSYWDTAEGRLTRADAYTDRYAVIDGVWLPRSRRVVTATDAGFVARELALSDVAVLDAPVARAPASEPERHGTRAG